MPTPIGFLADIVSALAPAVGSPVVAAYLIGAGMSVALFVSVALVIDASESPPKIFIAILIAATIPTVLGLFDSFALVLLGLIGVVLVVRARFFGAD